MRIKGIAMSKIEEIWEKYRFELQIGDEEIQKWVQVMDKKSFKKAIKELLQLQREMCKEEFLNELIAEKVDIHETRIKQLGTAILNAKLEDM